MIWLIVISIVLFVISILFCVVFVKNAKKLYEEKEILNLKILIFSSIITPVISIISVLLVFGTLYFQKTDFKQNNYNNEFSLLFDEMKCFVNNLSVEVKYNEKSSEPIILTKMEVIDELAYYLKKGKEVRMVISEDEVSSKDSCIRDKNGWFIANLGDVYYENEKYYKIMQRPDNECKYFEKINKQFRNIFIPIFDLLEKKDNHHKETHKRLFASYMSKNVFEAFLTTRWKKQEIPDINLLSDLLEYTE